MERVRTVTYPIAGRIQHGEKQEKNRVKELGYFIAKSQNSDMNFLMKRFKEKYPKQTKIKIRFFDENPLSIRYARYNQSGVVCYCMEENNLGKQKTKNGWKSIECKESCEYKVTNGTGKPICNREGTLKFLIPDVTTDRIFIMKIKGQTSINQLNDYLRLQKMQGKSVIGDYIITLNEKEQMNKEGKIFNNCILDIYKVEDFNSNNNIPQNKEEQISKKIIEQEDSKKENISFRKKEETKRNKNTQSKQQNVIEKMPDNEFEKCYTLISTKKEMINNKNVTTEYLVGNFVNVKDEEIDVIIPHQYAQELEECDLGTTVKLDLSKTSNNRVFTKTLEYVVRIKKDVAA